MKSARVCGLFLWLSVLIFASAASRSQQRAIAPPLHTEGYRIVDASGHPVRLTSVNWYGFDQKEYVVGGLDHAPLETIVEQIRQIGVNSVRLPWANETLEHDPLVSDYAVAANPQLKGKHAMAVMDAVIAALARAHIMPFPKNSFDFLLCRAAFKNFADPVGALQEMCRVLRLGGRAVLIDLSRDARPDDVSRAVDEMGLTTMNRLLTKMAFRTMLIRSAYTRSEFEQMLAQTEFAQAEIVEEGMGFEITMIGWRTNDSIRSGTACHIFFSRMRDTANRMIAVETLRGCRCWSAR